MRTSAGIPLIFALLGPWACSGGDSGAPSSSKDTGTSPTDAATSPPPRTPKVHRETAPSCPTARDPGHAEPGFSGCKSDDECKDGKNGRCIFTLGGANVCSYDACFVDADCGSAGVCDCRNSVQRGANACFKGNCHVDGDCKGGEFCSPSGVKTDPACMGIPFGAFGFFCHTATDTCRDDADCPGGGGEGSCIFDPDVLHWRCTSLICPG
jgi:hypothetical protein